MMWKLSPYRRLIASTTRPAHGLRATPATVPGY